MAGRKIAHQNQTTPLCTLRKPQYRTFGLRRLSRLRKFLQTQIFWYRWIAILKILGYAYLRIVSTAKLIVLWVVETTDPKRDYAAKK
jgi:hypothetical protein